MSGPLHRCPYCGANPDGDLADCIAALLACNNCKCDVAARGDWTGDGWAAIQRLRELHSDDAVQAAWGAAWDAKDAADRARANAAVAGRSVLVGYTGKRRHIQADVDTTLCGRVDGHRGSWFIRADGDEPLCQACEARQ